MTKKLIAVPILAVAACAIALLAADSAREQKLQQAIDLMESKGDLAKAIPMLEDISHSSDPALAARALLLLGQAEERQGDGKAPATYQRIVKEFPNQTDAVAAARKRLAALSPSKPPADIVQRRLCEECGDWSDVSADGRWMLGTDWETGDLEIRDASNGQIARKLMLKTSGLKTSQDDAESAIFSRDARQIAYVWYSAETKHNQLRVVANESGAKPRTVLDTSQYLYYTPVDWTRDGKRLLGILANKDRTWDIAWISLADGAVKPIKKMDWRFYGCSPRPRLSRDEKFILYSALAVNPSKFPPQPSDSRDQHIYTLSADGSSETDVVKGSNTNDGPVWTADGGRILFVSNRRGPGFALWGLPVRNGKAAGDLQLISEETGRMETVTASQSSYFFQNSRRGGQDVFVAKLKQDGTVAPPRRMTDYLGANVGASWSPDGKSIAFKRKRGDTNLWDLTVRSLETGEERKYPTGGPQYGRASWFHDSQYMLVGPGFSRLDLKTGESTPIAKGVGPGTNSISPDDKYLYVGAGTADYVYTQLLKVDLQTDEKRVVLSLKEGERIGSAVPSPDGRTLAVIVGAGNDYSLFTMDSNGGDRHERYKFRLPFASWASPLTWAHDGRSLFFGLPGQPGTPDQRVCHIVRMALSGGEPEPVGVDIRENNQLFGIPYIDLSPDDSQIVFATDEASIQQAFALDNVQSKLK